VTVDIGGVMGQRAQCKCVFIDVLRFPDERENEIAAADIMREIAEQLSLNG